MCTYTSFSFEARGSEEVSFDWRFKQISYYRGISILTMWNLLRCTCTFTHSLGKGTPAITTPIFFSHSGNTDATIFYICTQDTYIGLYKEFQVNSASFISVSFAK